MLLFQKITLKLMARELIRRTETYRTVNSILLQKEKASKVSMTHTGVAVGICESELSKNREAVDIFKW